VQIAIVFLLSTVANGDVIKIGKCSFAICTFDQVIHDVLESRDGISQPEQYPFPLPQRAMRLKCSIDSVSLGQLYLMICMR